MRSPLQVAGSPCPSCGQVSVGAPASALEPGLCAACQRALGVAPGTAVGRTAVVEDPAWTIPESALLWLASYFAMVATAVGALVGFIFVAGWLGRQIPGGDDMLRHPPALVGVVLSSAVAHAITLVLAWYVVTDGGRLAFLDSIGWGWKNGIRFRHVAGTFAIVYVAALAISLVGPEPDTPFKQLLETSFWVRLAIGSVAVLTAPIAEEVVYRGVLYPSLARRLGRVGAVVLVSGLFLLVHAEQYDASPLIMVPLGILSVALTTLRAVSGSILPSIVLHVLFNGVQVALLLLVPTPSPAP